MGSRPNSGEFGYHDLASSVNTDPAELWRFLPLGYLVSVVMETPVLVVGLSRRHPLGRRLFAGVWLTACTYPIVVLVLPQLVWRPLGETAGYWPYVAVAEVFAPAAECLLFWLAFGRSEGREFLAEIDPAKWKAVAGPRLPTPSLDLARDFVAIIAANLFSFIGGWWLFRWLQ